MMSQTDFTVLIVFDDDDDDEVKCHLHGYYYEMFSIKLCLLTYINCDCVFRLKLAIFNSTGQVALIYSRVLKVTGDDNSEF